MLAPPNLLGLSPHNFAKCWNHIHFGRYLDDFDHEGGASRGLVFWIQLLTSQHLENSGGGGQLKKHPVGKRGHILVGGTSLYQGLLGQKYMTNPINQYTSANPTIINGFTIFARTCNNLRFPIFLLSSFPWNKVRYWLHLSECISLGSLIHKGNHLKFLD